MVVVERKNHTQNRRVGTRKFRRLRCSRRGTLLRRAFSRDYGRQQQSRGQQCGREEVRRAR
jgi:hypothetical protein